MTKLLSNSLIYALGNAANSAALLLVVPFLVNTLTPAEYGAWSLFEVVVFLLNLLILAGLEVGLMRQYWFQQHEREQARLVGTTICTVIIVGALVVGVGSGLILAGLASDLPGAPLTLLLVLAIGWSDALCALLLTVFRIREQAVTFVLLSLARLSIFAVLVIIFVQGGLGLVGALTARLIASVALLGIGLILSYRMIVWQIDRALLWRIAAYGLPLLPGNLAAYVLLAADRYVMQGVLSLEDVAIYTFAYKIATVVDVLITRPFALDWAPRRFKIATQPGAEHKYAQALVFYLWAALSFSLLVVAGTPLVYALIAPPVYWPAMKVVPLILLAYIIYGLSYPLNIGIMLKDHTRALPVIGLIAALSCLGLCLWWIPVYGITGAAWATVVSYLIWTGLITAESLRLLPVRYPLNLIGGIIAAAAVAYSGMWLADQWWLNSSLPATIGRAGWVVIVMGLCGVMLWRAERKQDLLQPVVQG